MNVIRTNYIHNGVIVIANPQPHGIVKSYYAHFRILPEVAGHILPTVL